MRDFCFFLVFQVSGLEIACNFFFRVLSGYLVTELFTLCRCDFRGVGKMQNYSAILLATLICSLCLLSEASLLPSTFSKYRVSKWKRVSKCDLQFFRFFSPPPPNKWQRHNPGINSAVRKKRSKDARKFFILNSNL